MDKPQITVGIPVYNGERYIKRAVMSVLKQTFTDFELIVTDDGSTDGTLSILGSIDDPRLNVVSDGKNHGIAYRLNQQINLAQGKIFVRMDADDMMLPNRLEREWEEFCKHPEMDVVGARAVVIDEEDEILGIRGSNSKKEWKENEYFTSARFIHPTVAGRTEWFRKWRYSDQMSGNEDLDLWIRSHKSSTFLDIEEPLLFYRDPYRFRLKVYLFRQRRYLKCTWKLRHYMSTSWFFLLCVLRSIASSTMAILLTITGNEEKMISRRNQELNKAEKDKYNSIINSIKL